MLGRELKWYGDTQAGRQIVADNGDPGFCDAFTNYFSSPHGLPARQHAKSRMDWSTKANTHPPFQEAWSGLDKLCDGRCNVAIIMDGFNSGIISAAAKRCSPDQADIIIGQVLEKYDLLFSN